MKVFALSGWAATMAVRAASAVPVEDTCGDLGVMNVDKAQLPANIDVNNIRKCINHPEDKLHRQSARGVDIVTKRSCLPDAASPYRCSYGGYCYKPCRGNVQWCWAAANGGYGPWIRCAGNKHCSQDYYCGYRTLIHEH